MIFAFGENWSVMFTAVYGGQAREENPQYSNLKNLICTQRSDIWIFGSSPIVNSGLGLDFMKESVAISENEKHDDDLTLICWT